MLHDSDNVHSLSNMELNNQIRPFVTDPYLFLGTGDQHLLDNGLQATLNLSPLQKWQWLKVIDQQAAIKHNRHNALISQHQPIDSYFS